MTRDEALFVAEQFTNNFSGVVIGANGRYLMSIRLAVWPEVQVSMDGTAFVDATIVIEPQPDGKPTEGH